MKAVLPGIWILTVVGLVVCQDGFSQEDLLRLQQLISKDSAESNANRDTGRNGHAASSVSLQYQLVDGQDAKNRARDSRKRVFHIKNPFQQRQTDDSSGHAGDFNTHDNEAGASNQYASMQYSLPPEEFLQRMRAENQYLHQISTPAPAPSFTATPQPQYQYSSNAQNYYEPSSAQNMHQTDQKNSQINYQQNSLQYLPPSAYSDGQSTATPASPYVSTASNSQYIGTPVNSQPYVSSAASVFLSSPSNSQQYLSSPASVFQPGSPDYVQLSTSSNYFSNENNVNRPLQIQHYDNSAHGVRYPFNGQQYQNEVSSTTISTPVSSVFADTNRDVFQNSVGANSLSKSLQEVSALSQYQNQIQNGQQDSRSASSSDNVNTDTHRNGNNLASANNVFMNFAQPDYQFQKSHTKDLEHDITKSDLYSHGDYGWKISGKKAVIENDSYGPTSYGQLRSQSSQIPSNNLAYQYNFQNDVYKSQSAYNSHLDNYQNSRAIAENIEAQEFAKAAAKVHENMKQQQVTKANEAYYGHNYGPSYGTTSFSSQHNSNSPSHSNIVSTFYGNNDKQPKPTKYIMENSNSNSYSPNQNDLVTASPFYYSHSRDAIIDSKTKEPFDHAKALKNIVPIDETNVLSENGMKTRTSPNPHTRYDTKEFEQSIQHFYNNYKPLADAYYKDKNTGYGFNIHKKPDDISSSDGIKGIEQSITLYGKQPQNPDSAYNQGLYSENKRNVDVQNHQINFSPQASHSFQENVQPPSSIQQTLQRDQQQDLSSILKLNDIPYRLTQGLSNDALRLHNNNFDQGYIPQPVPGRINQNVGIHQLDATNSLLNKLILANKQMLPYNRPNEIDPQTGGLLSTINGFRVANPYNVDLKLIADMFKGKPAVDETRMVSLRDQFNKQVPLKLDMNTLQQIFLKNENYGSIKPYELSPISDGLSAVGNPYLDIYSNNRYPYQGGVKYSRSQEEEESILPLAESTNAHPIGAVIEQDEISNGHETAGVTDLTAEDESVHEAAMSNFENHPKPPKNFDREHRTIGNRHPNSLMFSRQGYQRKYPKNVNEPYPLLKPPPQPSRGRYHGKNEKRGRRRRVTKSKTPRILNTEPLFEAEDPEIATVSPVSILLKPPPAEEKFDISTETKDI